MSEALAATAADEAKAAAGSGRPGVISIGIKEKAALYAAYMPFISGGGLFVPTPRPAAIGDELYLLLTLMDDPTKLAITGRVVWITPAGSTGRQQGIGIQFTKGEACEQARAKIENYIGSALKSSRPTHTI